MNDKDKKRRVGITELAAFGQHLNSLRATDHTFELANPRGGFPESTLHEAIKTFQHFFNGNGERFGLRITLIDYRSGTLGHTTTEFARITGGSSKSSR